MSSIKNFLMQWWNMCKEIVLALPIILFILLFMYLIYIEIALRVAALRYLMTH